MSDVVRIGLIMGALLMAGPSLAEEHRPADSAIWSAEQCLRLGDGAFEHSLQEDLEEADRAALVEVFETSTFECLGLSMEICEGRETASACLTDLGAWVQETRGAVAGRLPDTLESSVPTRETRYERALANAEAEADVTQCDAMNDTERDRYCEIVSEGLALDSAYLAWRLARREAVVALEGHAPVDLEMIR